MLRSICFYHTEDYSDQSYWFTDFDAVKVYIYRLDIYKDVSEKHAESVFKLI